MPRRDWLALFGAGVAGGSVFSTTSSRRHLYAADPGSESQQGLVVGHPQAAAAGMAVLAGGGNAVDAAVTAALVAGVAAVHSCGIGGYGGHMTIAWPDGRVTSVDYNSTAPAAARSDMFHADAAGKVDGAANAYGWLAAGVPGTLAGLGLALARFGTLNLADALGPAIRTAHDGFTVSSGLAQNIAKGAAQLQSDPGSARLLFDHRQPLAEGATMTNRDLGRMLERLADDGSVDDFYRGRIAEQIADAFKSGGGVLTVDDLANYRAREVVPLAIDWNGRRIAMAPLTAGGLSVLQAIAALRALAWETWDHSEARSAHARIEAVRVAWNDRFALLGDAEHVDVPVERLLSDDYARVTASKIRGALDAGRSLDGTTDGRSTGGTIHLSVADADGMMVALTLTHGEGLGARVTVDGLGLILGHGISRFDPRPGRANSIAPGKRPLNNMCPTIVLEHGRPITVLGATGGRRIPNTMLDVLAGLVGRRLTLTEAAALPRMHTEGDRNLSTRGSWPEDHIAALEKAGYSIKPGPSATLQAIARDSQTGQFVAASG